MEVETSEGLPRTKSLREHLAMFRRRRGLIIVVAAVLAPIALVVALSLPTVYRSTATILVQAQEVPQDLMRSTITTYADERIQVIKRQLMTRAVLLKLVDKYGLYPNLQEMGRSDDIVERMRNDIRVTTINAQFSDRSGRRAVATIAFSISFDSPSPKQAQSVVQELVTLYLEENVKIRQQSVAETTAFLSQEAERVGKQIQEIETKLAEFKRRNVGRLPDSSAVNVQLAERTDTELQRVEREISMAQDRKRSLEAQLSLLKPNLPAPIPVISSGTERPQTLLPSEERLRALQAQLASTSAIYGADHPDVRRIRREIAALGGDALTAPREEKGEQRRQVETELATLRERYGEDHPDVLRLKRTLATLGPEQKVSAASAGADRRTPPETLSKPDNPVYVVTATQLEGVQRELVQLAALRDDLRAKQRAFDSRLMQIPEVEREYNELTRDYSNAQTHYREIKTKLMKAEGALELENELKAERFSLGEPANLPQSPFSPNRPLIALVGLVASLGTGIGAAFLREALDSSVKGPAELAHIASGPILTAIPYIVTQGELAADRRRAIALGAMTAVLAFAFSWGVHSFVKPLPVLLDFVTSKMRVW